MSSAGDQQSWTQPETYPPVSAASEEDFSNLLDFDLDLDLPFLDGNGFNVDTNQAQVGLADSSSYVSHNARYGGPIQERLLQKEQSTPRNSFRPSVDTVSFPAYGNDDVNSPWMTNSPYHQHMSVPPTPNSSKMYPVPYMQQQQQQQQMHNAMQDYRQYKDSGSAIYTPNESPQFVGNEASMPFPDSTNPNGFSLDPLTSPAMKPQPGSMQGLTPMHPHTAESSLTGSPVDLNFDDSANLSSSYNDRPRKTRKKAQGSTSVPNSAAPRPSTAANQKKRQGSTTTRSQAKSTAGETPRDRNLDQIARSDNPNSSFEYSESVSTSASPQPLYDARMGPPPKPNSVRSTPTLLPIITSPSDALPPATPASLMKLPNSVRSDGTIIDSPGGTTDQLQSSMEELTLPEAATPAGAMNRSSQGKHTPAPSVRSTPSIASRPPSGTLSSNASPTKAGASATKGSQARNSRKRNSTSSQLISPALRPRISPSIKPLLPEGAQHHISDETHALLLASKSNYQNLLEGNHLPGVTYPTELSTNLTSKRTSHKIAEQGRRNRINTALQEMQTLLPPGSLTNSMTNGSSPNLGSGGSGDLGNPPDGETPAGSKTPATPGAQGANSKAATVELAIEYIKTLNSQLADKESENEKLKKEMAELKTKLDADSKD